MLISDVIRKGLGIDVSVLMGANVAKEVALDEFSEATIGGRVKRNADTWQQLFNRPTFRVESTDDAAAVELCGALKNIVAIGAGFVDGLGFGGNTKAAIIRIGLVEMMNFCKKFYSGVKESTFFESCGVADIITTCFGGRNRKCADAFVTSGKSWDELEADLLGGQKLQGTLTAFEVNKVLKMTNVCRWLWCELLKQYQSHQVSVVLRVWKSFLSLLVCTRLRTKAWTQLGSSSFPHQPAASCSCLTAERSNVCPQLPSLLPLRFIVVVALLLRCMAAIRLLIAVAELCSNTPTATTNHTTTTNGGTTSGVVLLGLPRHRHQLQLRHQLRHQFSVFVILRDVKSCILAVPRSGIHHRDLNSRHAKSATLHTRPPPHAPQQHAPYPVAWFWHDQT